MKTTNKSLFSFTIFLAILGCFTSTQIAKVRAQVITPDNTLGNENSVVNTVENRDTINGGALRGTNLFHSFQEFGIRSGREAYFANPAGIQNILTRVTGGNPSNILGTLGVLGNANLFLINPKGIQFGPNARLDVGGSFFASTADSLVFGNGFEFSASNTLAPPLLTVNTPIGLRFRDNPGNITNQSVAQNNNLIVGLQVKPGNSLALVGGNVSVEQGGRLTAAGGRIELGGLAGAGTVGLDVTGNTFKLNFPANSLLSNVSLADDALVTVLSNGGGDIAVNANIFTGTNGGLLVGGIEGIATKKGGDITINSNEFSISGVGLQTGLGSGIYQVILSNASGNAGNININTKSFNASLGAVLLNSVSFGGTGNAGNIKLNANNLAFSNASIDASSNGLGNAGNVSLIVGDAILLTESSKITTNVQQGGEGKGGDIDIQGRKFTLTGGSQIQAGLFRAVDPLPGGIGTGGSIKINASDFVDISGFGSGVRSGIFASGERGSKGSAGSIDITTGDFRLTNLGIILAGTANGYSGGNITINAKTFEAINGKVETSLSGKAVPGILANAGNIQLNVSDSVTLKDGSVLNSDVSGEGNAGNVTISAGVASLTGSSLITTNIQQGGEGKGGTINIQGRKLTLTDGSQIQAGLFRKIDELPGGVGTGGSIKINASDSIDISGFNSSSGRSGIYASAETGSKGPAGSIDITTSTFRLTDSGIVLAGTENGYSGGNITINAKTFEAINGTVETSLSGKAVPGILATAGNIQLNVSDFVTLQSSLITTNVQRGGEGKGGIIDIKGRKLTLTDGSQIQAGLFREDSSLPGGVGTGGSIKINTSDFVDISGFGSGVRSGIYASAERGSKGPAGNIDITTGDFRLTNSGIVLAGTANGYSGGNITINAKAFEAINGKVETSLSGKAVPGILATAGNIQLNVSDFVTLDQSSFITTNIQQGGEGKGGNIDISARSLTVTGVSQVQAGLFRQVENTPGGIGTGGNIKINTSDFISISGVEFSSPDIRSGIFASGEAGSKGSAGSIDITTNAFRIADDGVVTASTSNADKGGNITINAKTFEATSGGQVITTAFDRGDAGNVTLKVVDRIQFSGESVINPARKSGIFASTVSGSTGNGGNIFIDPIIMDIRDGAGISAASGGAGNAGNIEVVAGTLTLDNEGFITTRSSNGQGGKITITANDLLLLRRKSEISTSAGSGGGPGSGGDIDINAGVLVAFPRENSDITANSFGGRGGNINIRTRGVFGIKVRPQQTELSDITASSDKDTQLSGQINLTNEVNPSQALVELPENVTNRTDQIARNPCQEGIGNEYIETGRGGLPTNPNQPLSSSVARVDLVNLAPNTGNTTASNTATLNNSTDKKIVPAQGWVTNEKGQVVLTAYDPTGAGTQRTQQNTAVCPPR